MSPEACSTQEVLPYWRWNMKQKLSSGYRYKDQTFCYSCVCPSTSKVPYPSDTGRRLGITNFVWSGYWQRLQIMSGNSLVLRPDSLSGHFFLVEVVEQGLSHEGKLGSAFSWAFWEQWGWLTYRPQCHGTLLTLESRQPWSYQKWEDPCDSLCGLRKLQSASSVPGLPTGCNYRWADIR